ncbi:hypothetical protein DSO57_1022099 [Entomophthora muscae]|uniref:Uncharacterized protein n=1 Tax=Entomophthora muscae TaxID=34485 RepID=A0ACC2T396_9FUNG|nr:hypothetical protein DSO57_1022099 [Entomophthora muscae]
MKSRRLDPMLGYLGRLAPALDDAPSALLQLAADPFVVPWHALYLAPSSASLSDPPLDAPLGSDFCSAFCYTPKCAKLVSLSPASEGNQHLGKQDAKDFSGTDQLAKCIYHEPWELYPVRRCIYLPKELI